MNIAYLSAHSILEFDEIKLLTELGHDVFSPGGSYENPLRPVDDKRPAIPNGKYNQQLIDVSRQSTKENLHPEIIAWADAILIMHRPDWVALNWEKIKHKKVILRTIGQSVEQTEMQLQPYVNEGLKIVRYSPKEVNIPGFAGQDAMIRFYKDEKEFGYYKGKYPYVINFTQSMKKRYDPKNGLDFCHYLVFAEVCRDLPTRLYGPQNEDTGFQGGVVSYEKQKDILRKHRVYFYTGTEPASYTLNFVEAMMTGIPIVALGPKLGNKIFPQDTYEIPDIIENGVNGFVSDDIEEIRSYLEHMLKHPAEAARIGVEGRKRAIEVFGKAKIAKQWQDFLGSI